MAKYILTPVEPRLLASDPVTSRIIRWEDNEMGLDRIGRNEDIKTGIHFDVLPLPNLMLKDELVFECSKCDS